MKNYYRTVLQVEVLTDEPYSETDLTQVEYDITEGHASGQVKVLSQEVVSEQQMADLLVAQGSDPSFLIEEEETE